MPPINHTALTLGELLSMPDETIRRASIGILKRLQKIDAEDSDDAIFNRAHEQVHRAGQPCDACKATCSQCNAADNLQKCHACPALICTACLDENGAFTYPDNLPHCPAHYPNA